MDQWNGRKGTTEEDTEDTPQGGKGGGRWRWPWLGMGFPQQKTQQRIRFEKEKTLSVEIQAVGNEGRILATAGVLESPGVMALSGDFHAGRQDQCGSHRLPLWDPEQESKAGLGRGHESCVLKEGWNQLRDRKPWSHLGDGPRNVENHWSHKEVLRTGH